MDEGALLAALNDDGLAAAYLDVLAEEPLEKTRRARRSSRTTDVSSRHIRRGRRTVKRRLVDTACASIAAFLRGDELTAPSLGHYTVRAEHGPRTLAYSRAARGGRRVPQLARASAALRCASDDAGNRARVSAKAARRRPPSSRRSRARPVPRSRGGPRAPRGAQAQQPAARADSASHPQRRHDQTTLAGDGRGRPHVRVRGVVQRQRREADHKFGITLVADSAPRSPRPRPAAHLISRGRFSIQEARVAQDPEPGALHFDVIWMRR